VHGDHAVQFYDNDEFLYAAMTPFLREGLRAGEPVIVIATEAHRSAVLAALAADTDEKSLFLFDAEETLATFMDGDMPDPAKFREALGTIIERAIASAPGKRPRAYGEMVDVLWRRGHRRAAIRLEELWNELAQARPFSLLCAYRLGGFLKSADHEEFKHICQTHSRVAAAERDPKLDLEQELASLQQRSRALESEIAERKAVEIALREAIAEQRRAERALEDNRCELEDFFENAAEGLHRIGPDGIIQWANRAELELLGYRADEYIGHHISEFHTDADVIDDILRRLRANEALINQEARLTAKDGSIKHVLIHSNACFRDGVFAYTRCFTRDITDRKRDEQERETLVTELRETVRVNELFAGVLAHDLRNPLGAIIAAAQLIRMLTSDDRIVRALNSLENSAGRMTRMIGQLLDMTKLRVGGGFVLEPSTTDLRDVCQQIVDELAVAHPDRRIALHITGDTIGTWDRDALLQVFSNLGGNAIVHGKPEAGFEIYIDGHAADEVTTRVTNRGSIPAAVLPHLFDPFYGTQHRQIRHSRGLGLGLFIAKQVVGAHGGSIDVYTCAEEDRTTFVIRLPRRVPSLTP
jgi:PAS domain S-box-containing protein